jgi:hypothetical protein
MEVKTEQNDYTEGKPCARKNKKGYQDSRIVGATVDPSG